MSSMHRRTFLAGAAASAVVAASAPYVHAQKKGGTLKFVPHADLKILEIRQHEPSLDDVFLAKTGRTLEGASDPSAMPAAESGVEAEPEPVA